MGKHTLKRPYPDSDMSSDEDREEVQDDLEASMDINEDNDGSKEDEYDDGGVDDEENSESDDGSEDDEENSESDECSDGEDDIWTRVIGMVLEKDVDLVTSGGHVKLTKVLCAVKTQVDWLLATADKIRGDNSYKQIRKTANKLKKQGYGVDEADDAAWRARAFLIRKEIVLPNMDIIVDSLTENDSDEDAASLMSANAGNSTTKVVPVYA